jgi:hypothetical protein
MELAPAEVQALLPNAKEAIFGTASTSADGKTTVKESRIVGKGKRNFLLSEEENRQELLDWLSNDEKSPADIAQKVNVQTQEKHYIPVFYFDINYTAHWSATSIWEHEETETTYESQVVFVNSMGQERNIGGDGWTPLSKTVPVEKKKMVIDKTESTSGIVSGNSIKLNGFVGIELISEENIKKSTICAMAKSVCKSLFTVDNIKNIAGLSIAGAISGANNMNTDILDESFHVDEKVFAPRRFSDWITLFGAEGCVDCQDDNAMNGVKVSEIATDHATIFRTNLEDTLIVHAHEESAKQIPGNRYEDFVLSDMNVSYDVLLCYQPVYYGTYEHNGKQYLYSASGAEHNNFVPALRPFDAPPTGIEATAEKAIEKTIGVVSKLNSCATGLMGGMGKFFKK